MARRTSVGLSITSAPAFTASTALFSTV